MIKFTVIIPFYNAEKYIRRSIESIINQTYKDIEILLINDGSTDNGVMICEEYKKKDNRIKIYNQINSRCFCSKKYRDRRSNRRTNSIFR